MFNDTILGVTTLSKIGGGAFDVKSIDLDWLNNGGSVTVNFVGEKLGGGQVRESFRLDGQNGLQTFAFEGMTNIVSMSWVQEFDFHQFDNVNIVPEPATMLALGAGLAAIARRRK